MSITNQCAERRRHTTLPRVLQKLFGFGSYFPPQKTIPSNRLAFGFIALPITSVRPNIISAEYSAEISADYSVRSRQLQIAETKRFSFRQIVTFSALTASFGRIFGQISAESAFFGRKFSVSAKITEYSVSAEFRFQFGFCQIFEAVFLFLHKLRNLFRSYAA